MVRFCAKPGFRRWMQEARGRFWRNCLRMARLRERTQRFRVCSRPFRACNLAFRVCAGAFRVCSRPFRVCDSQFRERSSQFRACNSQFRVCNIRFRARNMRFRACNGRFRVCEIEFRVCKLAFRVCTAAFRACEMRFCERHRGFRGCAGEVWSCAWQERAALRFLRNAPDGLSDEMGKCIASKIGPGREILHTSGCAVIGWLEFLKI